MQLAKDDVGNRAASVQSHGSITESQNSAIKMLSSRQNHDCLLNTLSAGMPVIPASPGQKIIKRSSNTADRDSKIERQSKKTDLGEKQDAR